MARGISHQKIPCLIIMRPKKDIAISFQDIVGMNLLSTCIPHFINISQAVAKISHIMWFLQLS